MIKCRILQEQIHWTIVTALFLTVLYDKELLEASTCDKNEPIYTKDGKAMKAPCA